MSLEMQLHVVAGLLRRGRGLDNLSTGVMLLGLALGLTQLWIKPVNPLLLIMVTAIVVTGLIEKYYAFRVAFDADLFQNLADDANQLNDRTVELDHALTTLGLLPVDKQSRSWAVRSQGALKLLRQQVLFLALELILMLAAILIFPWLPFVH
ncbi:hypothetical protein ACCD10_02640 [Pseudomonas sp. Pseusp122]|uniref:hypothetical protein n=1 Tax=unclassified Pseudomonas TaxID=196821 RepID=UPI0039A6CF0C